jgi:hypothetical protein
MEESECSGSMGDTPAKPVRRLTCRPIEMKRWIVEQTLEPGASVAQVPSHPARAALAGHRVDRNRLSDRRPHRAAPSQAASDAATGRA